MSVLRVPPLVGDRSRLREREMESQRVGRVDGGGASGGYRPAGSGEPAGTAGETGVAYRARARPRSGQRVAVRGDDRERERAGRAIRVGAQSIQVKGAPTEMRVVGRAVEGESASARREDPICGARGVPWPVGSVGRGKRSWPTDRDEARANTPSVTKNFRMSLFPSVPSAPCDGSSEHGGERCRRGEATMAPRGLRTRRPASLAMSRRTIPPCRPLTCPERTARKPTG